VGVAEPRHLKRLVGFDTSGEVFQDGDRILRGIYSGKANAVRDTLERCSNHDLFAMGIVATRELDESPVPELGYETVLEHERIPFVTYPHEWPAAMLQDAACFHTKLLRDLAPHGLTLKDWHPYNVLFKGTSPRFVDFTSIIAAGELSNEGYLAGRPRPTAIGALWDDASAAMYAMYRTTFEPYFAFPLEMMRQGRHARARSRLYDTALNSGNPSLKRREVFDGDPKGALAYALRHRLLQVLLSQRGPAKTRFLEAVLHRLRTIRVAASGSAYSSYYVDKGEDFPTTPTEEWTSKQRGVRKALIRFRPQTVLDFGSNTGWFSMLAAKLGSTVVAVDVDEASVDSLYFAARTEKLDILPLVANLASPPPERFAGEFDNEPSLSHIGGDEPLYSGPEKRLRCDMGIALAVVHHLVLGQGLDFDRVASTFAGLARSFVCIEFVDMSDAMIRAEPAFFPALEASPHSFEWYGLDNFVAALRPHFPNLEIMQSHPETRSLIIGSR
jgi:SAM-dependent methyltransferase